MWLQWYWYCHWSGNWGMLVYDRGIGLICRSSILYCRSSIFILRYQSNKRAS